MERGNASVITVVIGSVKCRWPSALFELVEAAIRTEILAPGNEHGLRQELEVSYLGPPAVSRRFAPVFATNGGGALVNVCPSFAG
jgi:hypothetical protein